jgi:hypothetical protein
MDCQFCGRSIQGTAIWVTGHPNSQYHALEDEHGNPAPKGIPSCWEKSAEGRLTLQEYLVELYANET